MFSWDDDPDLNITPLVDVMLVLMAILMITAPTITFQETITLPDGSKSVTAKKLKSIDVVLSSDKSISIDKKSEYKLDTFADDFTLFSKDIDRQSEIYIYADEQLPYKDVMRMLGVIKQAGFANVSLMTK